MNAYIINICQTGLTLLNFAMQGAAVLPLLSILGLCIGRRGSGNFILPASIWLGKFSLVLALAGPILFLGNFFLQMMNLRGAECLKTFFSAPAMNYSLSILLWILGICVYFSGCKLLQKIVPTIALNQDNSFYLKDFNSVIILFSGAALLYFTTFITYNWPFGGFPVSLDMQRAIMAILRNAFRSWFMALSPGGAFICVFVILLSGRMGQGHKENFNKAMRWGAFWAFVGYAPATLQNMGILIGASAAYRNFIAGYTIQLTNTVFIFAGLICFLLLLLRRKSPLWLPILGFFLYISALIAPRIIHQSLYEL